MKRKPKTRPTVQQTGYCPVPLKLPSGKQLQPGDLKQGHVYNINPRTGVVQEAKE